jgi:hypothetical protein
VPPWAVLGAAAGAVVLGVASRGEAIVLGLLLVALELRPTTLLAVAGALTASSWRWGTTSLEALAGAQAVLGPAGGVGPSSAAAGAWLGAAALVLALARRPDPRRVLPAGIVAASVLAGPAPGGDLPIRVIVAVAAAAAAYGLGLLRAGRPGLDRALAAVAAAAGIGAVLAVAVDAPGWPPATALADAWEGVVLGAGGAGLALLLVRLRPRPPWSTPEVGPNVVRPGSSPAHLRRHR